MKSEKKGKGKGFIEPGRSGSFTYTEKSLRLKKASKSTKKKFGFLFYSKASIVKWQEEL